MSTLIPIAVIIVVLALRMRRMSQMRPLKLEILWIFPAIYIALFALLLFAYRPAGMDWAWIAAAAAIGGVIGWYRGKMMQIHVDPATHALNQKGSPAAMILILVIVGIRMALRTEASSLHLNVNLVTDASLAFVAAMFSMVRLEMFLRAQRLLAEARASGPPTSA
jgi:hypothetical protein